jgi:hypothetical protein
MKGLSIRVGLAWLLALGGCSVAGAQAAPRNASVAEQYLFAAANMERTSHGLAPLKWDESLRRAAGFHVQQMAERGEIAHQYAGEPDLSARAAEAGARYSSIAENVAEGETAVQIQYLWMHSEGHRRNLLDATSDSVGIAVVSSGGELFAVEDFDRNVRAMSLEEQEQAIAGIMKPFGVDVKMGGATARATCAMDEGFAGKSRPGLVTHFTATQLTQLPGIVIERLRSGKYHEAEVGACPARPNGNFTTYRLAVLLYP